MTNPFKPTPDQIGWSYHGDEVEEYGLWFRESDDENYVYYAELIQIEHACGVDNEFKLDLGSMFVGEEEIKQFMLEMYFVGCEFGLPTRNEFLYSIFYDGKIDCLETFYFRVGKNQRQKNNDYGYEIDQVLRSNVKIHDYIYRGYISWRS